jgi:hypothetical protein
MKSKVFAVLLLLLATVSLANAQVEKVWLSEFKYDNNQNWTSTVGDTLVDNVIDTVYIPISPNRYHPSVVTIYCKSTNINNAEGITFRVDRGISGGGGAIYTAGTLDTLTSTSGSQARSYVFDGTSSQYGSNVLRVRITQLASAAATDSISYRLTSLVKLIK